MRSLSPGESAVVQSLLASEPISERERARRSEIPLRTFEGIRRRAYTESWVIDRYVPDPVRIGRPAVRFVLAQPFSERLQEVAERWKDHPDCVVSWRWPETLFGVFFSREGGPEEGRSASTDGLFRRIFEVHADARKPHIPVYFDFEGSWSRISDRSGTRLYPHPLPSRASLESPPTDLSESERRQLEGMVRRPFRPTKPSQPLRVSPFFLPRSEQRLLVTAAVEHRVFLDPTRVPPSQGREIERLVFIQGELLPGSSAARLFRRLASIRVLPFLFATDGTKVILGALSLSRTTPLPGPRYAVLATLQQYLQSIEIVREPVESLVTEINHRYDRLFLPAS